MNFRKTWVMLLLLGVVPAMMFYPLEWSGAADNLRYVSTTVWQPGDPSVLQLVALFASMIAWAWLKAFIYLFAVAAVPFVVADVCAAVRGKRRQPPPPESW
jgi:hypothetical protein